MSLSLMRRTWDSLVGYQRPLPPRRPITNPTRSRGIVLWSVCLLELSIGQQVVFVALLPLHQLLLASGLLLWWSQSTTKALLGRPKTNGLGVGSLLLFLLETRQPDTLMTMVAKGSASILWTFQRQHQTGKPRGIKSMKKAILKCISPKAFVVHDKWKASSPALADIGFKSAPPVNHSQGWRDRATGFHSNDIESEFSRLKRYVRERYGRLSFQCQGADDAEETDAVDAGDLYEYTFKTNVGNSFFDVLKALQIKSPC